MRIQEDKYNYEKFAKIFYFNVTLHHRINVYVQKSLHVLKGSCY